MLLYQILTAVMWSAGHLLWGLALAPLIGTVAPLVTIVRHLGLPVRRELRLSGLPPRSALLAVIVPAAALPVAYALGVANARWIPPLPENFDLYEELVPRGAVTFIGGLLGIVVLAPLAEELVFRGLVLRVFVRHMGLPLALLLSAALFAASHAAPWMLLPMTFLGVVLGLTAWATRSLTAAWIGHGLFNLAAYIELALTHDPHSSRLEAWSSQPLVWATGAILLSLALALLVHGRTAARRD
jgi:membrane protease YdiL (CAAX protease family)